MKLIDRKLCTGCGACKSICSKNAIEMLADNDGFLYPVINNELCINCGLCERVCPILQKANVEIDKVYAAIYDNDVRLDSSSGGIFSAIANKVLINGGYVCGAMIDDDNQVKHIIINKPEEIHLLRKSKYVQSNLGNVFNEIKLLLDKGCFVFFVGTGCQVNGLHCYLRKDYTNLLTADIICHGVPSPKVWNLYLDNLNNKMGNTSKVNNFTFRDKSIGWENYGYSYNYNNKKYYENYTDNQYSKIFLSDVALRPSCYHCVAKGENRFADLTLGDFWGYQNFDVKLDHQNKGLSILVLHTKKALDYISNIDIIFEEMPKEALNGNPSYFKSCDLNVNRTKFMNKISVQDFDVTVNRYAYRNVGLIRKIFRKIKRILNKILR